MSALENSMFQKTRITKKVVVAFSVLILSALAVSIGWAGRERWQVSSLKSLEAPNDGTVEEYKKKLEAGGDPLVGQYNLATLYFRQEKYQEAKEIFEMLLNSDDVDREMTSRILYNLGNTLFRLAEQEEDLNRSIELFQQSLLYYRSIIDAEEQRRKYSGQEVEKDEEAHFNYLVVRKRLKVLNDLLARQKKEQQERMGLYQRLVELKEKEEDIISRLKELRDMPQTAETIEQRNELLEKRDLNLKAFLEIKQQLLDSIPVPQKQPGKPAAPTI